MERQSRKIRARSLSSIAFTIAISSTSAFTNQESTSLAEKFQFGAPPSAVESLPSVPEVVKPLFEFGKYGGSIRCDLGGSNDHNSILSFVSPQVLTRWKPDFSKVVPNVAESWTVNDEGSEFTFTLREGMKWPDGSRCKHISQTSRQIHY